MRCFGSISFFPYSEETNCEINLFHDTLIRRTVELSEQMLEDQGFGKPPVRYAFMLFGSGGRSEQTLWSDQDNGFIYEESPHHTEEELEDYFSELVACILQGLHVLGYPPCQGNVVSSNKQWRKSCSAYSLMLREWLENPNWESVRYLLIVADMRCVYGSNELVEQLRAELLGYVRQHPLILKSLLSNTLHHKISLGVFGQLITERYGEDAGGFDIKYGAYIPIVNGIRLLAIQSGITESSTIGRMNKLLEASAVPEGLIQSWREAFAIAVKLRDQTPFQLEGGYYTTRSKISAEQLTKDCKLELKFCLKIGMDLQKYVSKSIDTRVDREKG
ncbi:DUF294 nucleotidyltransferase-like domain-containing protein [Paenibacillus hexagrammi]|uniref:DUF294 nucleotidyltransferase-like domain-containing protein n=1 Tax=Paenibacillus hexagrammi TaxID=2908839 RepID=A0ABY3SEL6_9BACL|nr:DUF294 nucleotidyltransferase-like domain-containing protein [Paenibacillus sp. YPD9-1]UJF31596.1 DUF294 nucleotidyltransferase-like domain-containing protein [Paenibacillus sp. YPD9-1]